MPRTTEGNDTDSRTDDLKQAAAQAGRNVRQAGEHVKEAATQKYNEIKDQASIYYNEGRERAAEFEKSLESYVQEKPLKSVLIAAGIGLVLGMVWKRR